MILQGKIDVLHSNSRLLLTGQSPFLAASGLGDRLVAFPVRLVAFPVRLVALPVRLVAFPVRLVALAVRLAAFPVRLFLLELGLTSLRQ